ncbi:S-layer protein [Bremerella sp. T1]|uniref:S-layer protein n=1 Tax=Bremerella sp. TYQ1 TaxID=3119568 RepID=UPI001CCBC1A0|nr:S-layer protein [Bremerella volcania]UBM34855.1 S-layer protein [Bremerella volcania]
MPFANWFKVVCFVGVALTIAAESASASPYEMAFSTYLGGSDWEHARDIFVDEAGNVYVVGGTQSPNFPVTEGAFQTKHDMSGTQVGSGGYCDAFVCKYRPDGTVAWCTLLGGPNYDRAYAVEVDRHGYVYVSGRGGPGFPVTDGAFQTEFRGNDEGIYGMQNAFLVKLSPDGSELEWGAFVGVGNLCRELSLDDQGDVYVALHYLGQGPLPPSQWFANTYQAKPAGGVEIGAIKIASDGSAVRWATWLGGSRDEVSNCGIRLDAQKNVYLNFTTQSDDVPTTEGAHDRTFNGDHDAFIAKLSPDGSRLIYGTYFGGREREEGNSTHSLAVDPAGHAYLLNSTTGDDMPVTPGVLQSKPTGQRDMVVSKFSPTGKLLLCTYLGGSSNEGSEGIYANAKGEVAFAGTTDSADYPISSQPLQKLKAKSNDATVTILSADFDKILYSTYLGGESYDYGRAFYWGVDGSLYLTGSVNGSGWPIQNAAQKQFAGGGGGKELCYEGGCYAGDVIVAKLTK